MKKIKYSIIILIISFNSERKLYCIDNNDTTNLEENFVELQMGYFHYKDAAFTSDGISFSGYYETIGLHEIKNGYYFNLRRAFKDKINSPNPTASFSIGAFLNYLITPFNKTLILRGGIGLGYPIVSYNFISMLMLEFIGISSGKIYLSFSILEEVVNFRFLLPIQINVGIRF